MKVIYRGECKELYGKEIEYPDHECVEHAVSKFSDWVETHGLDCGPFERWHEEWTECSVCHQIIEAQGFEEYYERQPNSPKAETPPEAVDF